MIKLPYTIILSDKIKNDCASFAENSYASSGAHYAKRNQSNPDKVKLDIKIGKMAEFAAWSYLFKSGVISSRPDLKIYEQKNKTLSPDLKSGNLNFHIKACSKNSGFPLSWAFQYGNKEKGHFDPVLQSSSELDIAIFCVVDGTRVTVMSAFQVKNIFHYKLLKDPKLDRLKNQKLFVYWDDIKKIGVQSWFSDIPAEKQSF